MTGRDQRLLVVLAAVAALWLMVAAALGATSGALYFAPLVTLLVPLLLGRYVGEEPLARLRERVARTLPRARREAARPASVRAPRALFPRGGRLLAAHLAVRPPPALAAIR